MAQQQAGADPATLEANTITTGPDGTVFRWAKPIVMDAQCTVCHGKAVDNDLYADIKAIYPGDEAMGFAPAKSVGFSPSENQFSHQANSSVSGLLAAQMPRSFLWPAIISSIFRLCGRSGSVQ